MRSRITPQTKAIADAHIKAMQSGVFKDTNFSNRAELIEALKQGYTFPQLMREIEVRFASTTSLIINRLGGNEYMTDSYKKAIYKGFKILLQQ